MIPERLARLTRLRHALHRAPELSGDEEQTAARVAAFLSDYGPDAVLTGLGGHGVAAEFRGDQPGLTVMIRAELDALPIHEETGRPYASAKPDVAHLCGHDGHMTMVAALAEDLRQRPARGRVILLFQPAEETGQGAMSVRADPRWRDIAPDFAFSLHNTPGLPEGEVSLNTGAANCASRGMKIALRGKTSHAAAPGDGVSPMAALAQLMPRLTALGAGGPRTRDFAQVTVTHAQLGARTFGIAPGQASLWVTLRTATDAAMTALVRQAETTVQQAARAQGLTVEISYHEVFEACENHPDAVEVLQKALIATQTPWRAALEPQSWSEDFGQYSKDAKAAMFWLGSGLDQPQLHNPDYDFPDALIPTGVRVFRQAIRSLLG